MQIGYCALVIIVDFFTITLSRVPTHVPIYKPLSMIFFNNCGREATI